MQERVMVTTLQQWTAKKSRLDSHFLSNSRTGRMCCALIKLDIDTFSNFFTGLMDLSAFFFKWRKCIKNIIDIQFMHKRSKVLFHKANEVWFPLGTKITGHFVLFLLKMLRQPVNLIHSTTQNPILSLYMWFMANQAHSEKLWHNFSWKIY